jgi:hypothetical protein
MVLMRPKTFCAGIWGLIMAKTKRRNSRYTKRGESMDPFENLAAGIIIDALLIASGRSRASDKRRAEEASGLRGKTCQRWAGVIGVDIRAALEHEDSLVRLEEKCK